MNASSGDTTPDGQDRIDDFLARHGGAAARPTRSETREAGLAGRSEVYAADGYVLVCEWSLSGTRQELNFTEIPPEPKR